jgi:hypothetical protein
MTVESTTDKGGAPVGNNNANKNKYWSDALRKHITQNDHLPALAKVLVDKALDGDMTAIKEIGDRLEGKPNQSVTGLDGVPLLPPIIQFAVDENTTE